MENKDYIVEYLKNQIAGYKDEVKVEKIGTVVQVGDGIARISGLSDVAASEILDFGNNLFGVALNLEEDLVGAMILGDDQKIKEGSVVKCSGRILSVPVGKEMLGRVVNPLGLPRDQKGEIPEQQFYPVEKIAPRVITRRPVDTPLQTGVIAIDSMIPIGRGQRELIIGDRQTGKTALVIDTIINQKNENVICIYVAIGQRESKVARLVAELEARGAMEYTTVVLAGASDPASLIYLAPFTGCALGEYFMDQGKDVLVIYDDLSKHAISYREIALLLKRPPGREAYPGDIFYLHSRLLERAACLDQKYGGGTLTALPIIETQAGEISAYIPTNVISITDGQIFLESDLFYQGIRPAINFGLSVSRVGSAAQNKAMKKVAGKLKLEMAQYRELAAFAQFGSDLDEATQKQISRGRRLTEILKQSQYDPLPIEEQIVFLFAAVSGLTDSIPPEKVKECVEGLYKFLLAHFKPILETIRTEKDLSPTRTETKLRNAINEYISGLDYAPKPDQGNQK